MHRQTPYDIAFRGYSAGGARSCIDQVDDSKLMQESNDAHGMLGESWPTAEAPQNYGFTSVVADATKDAAGKIKQCAEGFMSFIGGNRNFPVMGMMDDRRHRLKNLAKDAAKGASAMFGLKEWGQQLLNTEDGWFMTGNTQKKNRLQLVDNQNGQTQQQQPGSSGGGVGAQVRGGLLEPIKFKSKSGVEFEIEVVPFDAGGGSGGGSSSGNGSSGGQGGQQGSKPTGQKTLHKEESSIWFEQNSGSATCAHGDAYSGQRTGSDSSTYYKDRTTSSGQSTSDHTHILNNGAHIWVSDGVCYSDMPLIIKTDTLCKA
jgi:phage gp45-like